MDNLLFEITENLFKTYHNINFGYKIPIFAAQLKFLSYGYVETNKN